MSEDTRKYKRIVRVSDEADAQIRAYAAEHSITPSEACIALVKKAVDPTPAVVVPPAPALALPVLPDDLTEAIARRATAKGTTPEEQLAAVLRVGLKRLEAVDRYAAKK